MSTNSQQAPDAGMQTAVKGVMQSLGVLYKECHALDPSGQANQAIQQIMQAVSEVANNIGQMGGSQDPFMQAAQNVQAQMQAQPQDAGAAPPDMGGGAPPQY